MTRTLAAVLGAAAVAAACLATAPAAHAAREKKPTHEAWGAAYGEGISAMRAKDFRRAETALLSALEIVESLGADKERKQTLEGLVELWQTEREWAAADPYLKKLVAQDEALYGPEDLELSFSLSKLALNSLMMRRFDEAEAAYERALAIVVKHKGPDDPGAAKLRTNLGETYRRANHLDKAEALYKTAIEQKEAAHGADSPELASSLNDLGLLYNGQKRFAEALPVLERACRLAEKMGPDAATLGRVKHNLADSLAGLKRYKEAEPLYQDALRIASLQQPPDRPAMGSTLNNLGNLYQYQDRFEEAKGMYERAIEVRTLEYGPRHSSVKQSRLNLAVALDRLGQVGEAAKIRAEYADEPTP